MSNSVGKLDQINPQISRKLLVLYSPYGVILASKNLGLEYSLENIFQKEAACRIQEKQYRLQNVVVMVFDIQKLVLVVLVPIFDSYVIPVHFVA